MKKSRFSEEQIIGMVKQQEAGVKTADLCREYGIGAATVYAWKAKKGGLNVSEAQRLKRWSWHDYKTAGLLPTVGLFVTLGVDWDDERAQ